MSINFLAGGGDYDQEPAYVIKLRERIAELEAIVWKAINNEWDHEVGEVARKLLEKTDE